MKNKLFKANWTNLLKEEMEELTKHYDKNIKCDKNCFQCKLDKMDEYKKLD
jgi:hypothetical protein